MRRACQKIGGSEMTFESKFRNYVGRLKQREFSHDENVRIADELLIEYNKERKAIINGWHGKSSFTIEQVGDNLEVTKYQKPERGAEPKEVRTTISLIELRNIQNVILLLWKEKGEVAFLTSRQVAEYYYSWSWDKIFSSRKIHNKFTIILNVLDKRGFIEYRGGRVYLKNG